MIRLRLPIFCLAVLLAGACGIQSASAARFDHDKLKSVGVTPHEVVGGSTTAVTGMVTLEDPAPTGGTVITLASSDTLSVNVPSMVTVAAGATTATFAVTTLQVDRNTYTEITAGLGHEKRHCHLEVHRFEVTDFDFDPSTIKGGGTAFTGFQQTVGTITLSAPAGPSGVVVTLTSDGSGTSLANTITVPAGATSVNFSLTAGAVTKKTVEHMTATVGHSHKTTKLTVTP